MKRAFRARANSTSLLSSAVSDYQSAKSAVTSGVTDYDAALAAGADTSAMPASFQLTQINYTISSSRLGSALDTTSAVLGTVLTAVTSAQASLNTQTTRDLHSPFDQWRADLGTLFNLVTAQQQNVSTAKRQEYECAGLSRTTCTSRSGSWVNCLSRTLKHS